MMKKMIAAVVLRKLISAAAGVALLLVLAPRASALGGGWSAVGGYSYGFNTIGQIGAGWAADTGFGRNDYGTLYWLNGGPYGTWEPATGGNWISVTTDWNGNPWAVSYEQGCTWTGAGGVEYPGGYVYFGTYNNGWTFLPLDARTQCVYSVASATGGPSGNQVYAIQAGGKNVLQWDQYIGAWLNPGIYSGAGYLSQIAAFNSTDCGGPEIWALDTTGAVLRSTSSIGGRFHTCGQNAFFNDPPSGCQSPVGGITTDFVECANGLYEFNEGGVGWSGPWVGPPECSWFGNPEYGNGLIAYSPNASGTVYADGSFPGPLGYTAYDWCYYAY